MKLDAPTRHRGVLDGHDLATRARSRYAPTIRQARRFSDEAVITANGKVLGQTLEKTRAPVSQRSGLAVQGFPGADDTASGGRHKSLMTQANPQHGDLPIAPRDGHVTGTF